MSAIDSLIRAEFVANAKKINKDLIKGDLAAEQNDTLAAQLSSSHKENTGLKGDVKILTATADKSKTDLEREKTKTRGLQLEVWGWRFLASLAGYVLITR